VSINHVEIINWHGIVAAAILRAATANNDPKDQTHMLTVGDTFPSFSLKAVKGGAEGL